MLRKEPEAYKKRVKEDVERSKNDIPPGFVMPTSDVPTKKIEKEDDRDFWIDSDLEDGFGGSDTDDDNENEADDELPNRESDNEDDEMVDTEDENQEE